MTRFHYWWIKTFLKVDKWYTKNIHSRFFRTITLPNITISSFFGHLIKTGEANKFHHWFNHAFDFLDWYLDWVGVIDGQNYPYSKMGHCEKWYHLYCRGQNFVTYRKGKIYYGNTWKYVENG